jgi:amino acid permease
MGVGETLAILGAVVLATLFFGFMGAQPRPLLTLKPRWAPWRFLMLLGVMAIVAVLAHLVNMVRGG